MEPLSQLTEDEFEHIEEEIARTAKGRSFLRRFRRQALGAATEEIRTMLEEFRLSWRQQTQALEAVNRISVLRQELIEMAASIERARREVAALQPEDADNNRIITATSELDAIVISTERASFEILNAAERLMDLSSRFREGGADPELCSMLDSEVTSIFTACSFQDLTGQRTSKVVNALRYIEQRVNAMISIWGVSDAAPIEDENVDTREDSHLLSGPQMEGKGVSQNDVDALFDEPAPAVSPDAAAALEAVSKLLQAHQAGIEADQAPAASRFSQSDIDALLSGEEPPAPRSSQADVDSLFDAPAPPRPAPAPAKAAPPPPKPAPSPAKAAPKASQADVDSMFDAPAPPKAAPKAASQADVDSLFDAPAPPPKPAPPPPKPAPAPAPAKPPPVAAKAAPPPPPPPAKPKAKEPAAAPTASPLDQSAIDALFG